MSDLPTFDEVFANATPGDIHGPDYRPHNVQVVPIREGFAVRDFDGTCYATAQTTRRAEEMARVRRGVIKAALTRRLNKARRQGLQNF